MTLAPGMPLADLVENKLLENDTTFRANLHRCLDLLVSRFFYGIVNGGVYHGDLHSGNIFYSFDNNQITLIDFGSVGRLNLFGGEESTLKLIDVIIMAMFSNFDTMFDILTDVLNEKCMSDKDEVVFIDKNSEDYINFRKDLTKFRIQNIRNNKQEKLNQEQYLTDLSGEVRLQDEKQRGTLYEQELIDKKKNVEKNKQAIKSIYDHLERIYHSKETVSENTDLLNPFTEIVGESKSITFSKVMELIIKFYSAAGINVPVKFADLNSLQKGYALLLGVLSKADYNSYRMNMAIKTSILAWSNIGKSIVHPSTTVRAISTYWKESSNYAMLEDYIDKEMKKRTSEI